MKSNSFIQTALSGIICLFFLQLGSTALASDTLKHEEFIKRINNSSSEIFHDVLNIYDDYLEAKPLDVKVHLEKCRFIQYAQYDDYEEYNPNQDLYDSCYQFVVEKFGYDPRVIMYEVNNEWGESLDSIIDVARESIEREQIYWTDLQKGELFYRLGQQYLWDDDFELALHWFDQAIIFDKSYAEYIEYARVLVEMEQHDKALEVLNVDLDTSMGLWDLSRRAQLYVDMEEYDKALHIYEFINEMDTTYNDNSELATTLEGIGRYAEARTYMIADTGKSWGKEQLLLRLYEHDLNHHGADTAAISYNWFRDLGYAQDPLALHRLKLVLKNPIVGWRFRDLLGLLSLVLSLVILFLIPYLWILPLYFIGKHWNLLKQPEGEINRWGLRSFWRISAGYVIAAMAGMYIYPELITTTLSQGEAVFEEEQLAVASLAFIVVFSLFCFAELYKVNWKRIISPNWEEGKTILRALGLFFVFKIGAGLYMKIGMSVFGVSADELAHFGHVIAASHEELTALTMVYGGTLTFVLTALFVPIYEELAFRGIIQSAGNRYLTVKSALIVQAALFACVHFSLFLFPVFFAFGIVVGQLRNQTGGLLGPIVFHAINNAVAIGFFLARM